MRVTIAGSRDHEHFDLSDLEQAIQDSGFQITEVLVTGDEGVSELALKWAEHHQIPVRVFSRDLSDPSKASAAKRNSRMADHADALICLHHGTKGSWSIMQEMHRRGKPVHEVEWKDCRRQKAATLCDAGRPASDSVRPSRLGSTQSESRSTS